ncbi:MAG: hypothetical protein ACK56I_21025, partial [bacterium]
HSNDCDKLGADFLNDQVRLKWHNIMTKIKADIYKLNLKLEQSWSFCSINRPLDAHGTAQHECLFNT